MVGKSHCVCQSGASDLVIMIGFHGPVGGPHFEWCISWKSSTLEDNFHSNFCSMSIYFLAIYLHECHRRKCWTSSSGNFLLVEPIISAD